MWRSEGVHGKEKGCTCSGAEKSVRNEEKSGIGEEKRGSIVEKKRVRRRSTVEKRRGGIVRRRKVVGEERRGRDEGGEEPMRNRERVVNRRDGIERGRSREEMRRTEAVVR